MALKEVEIDSVRPREPANFIFSRWSLVSFYRRHTDDAARYLHKVGDLRGLSGITRVWNAKGPEPAVEPQSTSLLVRCWARGNL